MSCRLRGEKWPNVSTSKVRQNPRVSVVVVSQNAQAVGESPWRLLNKRCCIAADSRMVSTKIAQLPHFEIPNHSPQSLIHPHHFLKKSCKYGKLMKVVVSVRLPLHSSCVKGDQRFAAIHQHKLPDLQRRKQQGNIR